jgi:isopenicillin N synthase-like dioxygenase
VGGETLVAGKDVETGTNGTIERGPDLKELFAIGPSNPASGMPARRWPTSYPPLVPAYERYYEEMEKLASDLLKGFALALRLDENWFEDKIDKHCSALRTM